MASARHAHRLDVVAGHILASGAHSVLDLGCGAGELIDRLLTHAQIERIVGVDSSPLAWQQAGRKFAGLSPRVSIRQGSYAVATPELRDFDAAALVETIEHLDCGCLGAVESAVFGQMRPTHVLVTTPNRDYNPLHGLAEGQRRHPEHRFEWGRARFRQWARRVAARYRFGVAFYDIGEIDPQLGASTQMARFER